MVLLMNLQRLVSRLLGGGAGLAEEALSDQKRIFQVARESGLYEPMGSEWQRLIKEEPEVSYSELRQKIGQLSPPLSETIIQDRGPR